MQVRRRAIHVTADGRRLLVMHGDEFDAQTQFGNLQERVRRLAVLPHPRPATVAQSCAPPAGLRYWSLSEFLKRRSHAAERYIERYRQAGLDEARRRGLDGIVCGHIHRAALEVRRGLVYANDGDWVESLTALVEDHDGTLRLLSHMHATHRADRPATGPVPARPRRATWDRPLTAACLARLSHD